VLGPDATLRRGYSITKTADGKLIRSARDVRFGVKLITRVADGEFASLVQQETAPAKARFKV
jgi:exodeoxyribonuclease VII large subunit